MADIAFLRGLVTGIQHDNDHPATADKVQTLAWTVVNPHFGHLAFDCLPIAQTARLRLTQPGCDAYLGALVLQGVKPRYELFSLADGEHRRIVSI